VGESGVEPSIYELMEVGQLFPTFDAGGNINGVVRIVSKDYTNDEKLRFVLRSA
jgi:hypothetical protein